MSAGVIGFCIGAVLFGSGGLALGIAIGEDSARGGKEDGTDG